MCWCNTGHVCPISQGRLRCHVERHVTRYVIWITNCRFYFTANGTKLQPSHQKKHPFHRPACFELLQSHYQIAVRKTSFLTGQLSYEFYTRNRGIIRGYMKTAKMEAEHEDTKIRYWLVSSICTSLPHLGCERLSLRWVQWIIFRIDNPAIRAHWVDTLWNISDGS